MSSALHSMSFRTETNHVAEKLQKDIEGLSPPDVGKSLLMDPEYRDLKEPHAIGYPLSTYGHRSSIESNRPYRDQTPPPRPWRHGQGSTESLVSLGGSTGHRHDRSTIGGNEDPGPRLITRQPTVPIMETRTGRQI